MTASRIVTIALVLAAAACGRTSQPPAPASEGKQVDTGPPIRGALRKTDSGFSFTACGAPAALTLVDPTGDVTRTLASLEGPVGSAIYVEVEGAVKGDRLTVSRLVRARGPREHVACETPVFAGDFVASGNEPFWSVEITENGITFRSPEEPKGVHYPYGLTPSATGAREYTTKIDAPRVSTLEVVIASGRCVDSMSGDVYGYVAHVTRDGKKLEGCAAAGVPTGEFGDAPLDELARYLGTYPENAFWTTPPLGARLDVLLGAKGKAFRENIEVHTALMRDAGTYYLMGNAPHRGGLDNALFLADPDTDTIEVILFVNGVKEEFKEGDRDVAQPPEVVKMLENLPAP